MKSQDTALSALKKHMQQVAKLNREAAKKRDELRRLLNKWSKS